MEHRRVIKTLSEALESFDPCTNMTIQNYNNYVLGTNHVGNYIEALAIVDTDFDVVQIFESADDSCIVIQEDDEDKIRDFAYEVNRKALEHDKVYGDGKYWRERG